MKKSQITDIQESHSLAIIGYAQKLMSENKELSAREAFVRSVSRFRNAMIATRFKKEHGGKYQWVFSKSSQSEDSE